MVAASQLVSPQAQEHSFKWNMISQYEADMEEQAFTFLVQREGKDPRWIRIYSPYVRNSLTYLLLCYCLSDLQFLYMERCVDRINEELLWKKVSHTHTRIST